MLWRPLKHGMQKIMIQRKYDYNISCSSLVSMIQRLAYLLLISTDLGQKKLIACPISAC
jgi:hypothetical protein